jgi:hypothetical protein
VHIPGAEVDVITHVIEIENEELERILEPYIFEGQQ